jgi:ABC-type nitrate/sulfonate/bicarbonate transport system permease component
MLPIQTFSYRMLSTMSLLAGVAIWWFASVLLKKPELLPLPMAVITTFIEMLESGELARSIGISLVRVLVGFLIGTVAGIGTGVLLGAFRSAGHTVGPVFEFMKGIPPIALVPLIGMWLGIGEASKYAVIAYLVWIVVTINTATGVRETPRIRIRSGEVLGLSRTAIFLRVVLPSAVPFILIGMRSALGFAFVGLVSAELIAANSGIGQIIMDSRFSLQTDRMFVGLLVLGILGALAQLAFDRLVSALGANRLGAVAR